MRCEGFIYLSLITFLVIKSHPLIVFAGIWNFLVIDPLNGGALQEITDLKGGRGKKQNKTFEYLKSHFLHSHSQASHFIGPHSRTRIRLLGWKDQLMPHRSPGLRLRCWRLPDGTYDHRQQNPSSISPLGCLYLANTSWHSPEPQIAIRSFCNHDYPADGRSYTKSVQNAPVQNIFTHFMRAVWDLEHQNTFQQILPLLEIIPKVRSQ